MHTRTARVIAWLTLGMALLVATVGLSLVALNFRTPLPPGVSSVLSDAALILAFLPYAVVGALIVSRQPANRIGWLFLVSGLLMDVGLTAFEYAIYGDLTNPGTLPGTSWALRTSQWVSFIPFLTYAFLFLLFPDGHLPSQRWRPVALLAALSIGWLEANAIAPDVIPLWPARELTVVAMLLCASAPLVRYRRSESDERHQIKWFAFAALPAVALLLPGLFVNLPDAWFVPFVVVTGAVPVAAAIGIFKYRLYDIDVIIDKTLVYGGLAAFITAVYVVVVVVVGAFIGATEVLSLVATAIVAVAFQPVRLRVHGIARRIVYGDLATPYETLSTFAERLSQTYSIEDVLPNMARILAEGTGASRSEVWLRVGSELRQSATWPPTDGPAAVPVQLHDGVHVKIVEASRVEAASREADVRYHGQLLGALVVLKSPYERFMPAEEKLLADLSSHAGLVLRNMALIADLRASRQRLVSAQDDERRKIERNLHDGAQQQLVALAVKMRLIEGLAGRNPQKVAELAHQAAEETGDALDSLRELARGIYPPLLAQEGLAAALESQGRKAPIPVSIRTDGVARYPQDFEAAIYFCCLEAVQNAAKYASAGHVSIALSASDGDLTFSVSDDGIGFDPADTPRGAGLTNMRDRIDALRGTFEIESAPNRGTTVRGRIPVGPSAVGRAGTT
jgi:signal transduction histidine kinase